MIDPKNKNELFDRIIAVYTGNCSEKEKAELEEWINKSKENEQLYLRVTRVCRSVSISRANLRSGKMKKNVWHLIDRTVARKKRQRRVVRLGSAASILVVICFSIFFIARKETGTPSPMVNALPFLSDQIQLTLSSGEVIPIISGRDFEINEDSLASILNKGNTLIYTPGKSSKQVEYNTITVPPGGEYAIVLSDGSKVHLNSGSELRYPISFADSGRDVYLSGEAFFEIHHDSTRQFTVTTGDLKAIVLGTAFNIKSYPQQDLIMTTLEEGSLKIVLPQEEHVMTPGTQVRYAKSTGSADIRQVETELYTSWKEGYYFFKQMKLEEIMSTISIWYNLDIVYEHDESKQMLFSGQLKRFDNFRELLDNFEMTNTVKFKIEGKKITIRKK